jgi:hypothetical protein
MSLGTSIFLSSLVLAFVVLFIATKDRWSWKKIILWPLAGLILIASGLWIYGTIEKRWPKVQTSFWDIPLGATESDVKFLKGAPRTKDQDTLEYLFEDSFSKQWDYIYRIRFKNGKVWLIEYFPGPNTTYGPRINGINIRDSLEQITKKFGSPSHISTSKDELSRVFSFTKYQVAFELKENRVVGYGVFDSKVAPKGVRHKETVEK